MDWLHCITQQLAFASLVHFSTYACRRVNPNPCNGMLGCTPAIHVTCAGVHLCCHPSYDIYFCAIWLIKPIQPRQQSPLQLKDHTTSTVDIQTLFEHIVSEALVDFAHQLSLCAYSLIISRHCNWQVWCKALIKRHPGSATSRATQSVLLPKNSVLK